MEKVRKSHFSVNSTGFCKFYENSTFSQNVPSGDPGMPSPPSWTRCNLMDLLSRDPVQPYGEVWGGVPPSPGEGGGFPLHPSLTLSLQPLRWEEPSPIQHWLYGAEIITSHMKHFLARAKLPLSTPNFTPSGRKKSHHTANARRNVNVTSTYINLASLA